LNPFSAENKKFADLLGIYRWAISNKVTILTSFPIHILTWLVGKSARQTVYFQEFHQKQSHSSLGEADFNDRRELKLVLEVGDILDELNMLFRLIETQQEVLDSLLGKLRTGLDDLGKLGSLRDKKIVREFSISMENNNKAQRELQVMLHELRRMKADATYTQKMVSPTKFRTERGLFTDSVWAYHSDRTAHGLA
jgi:hypothetical protein